MLKELLFLLMTLALVATTMAQNLVPNGSFEDTVNCGISTASINKVTHWYNPNNATPDIWECDLDRGCGMAMSPASPLYQPSYDGLRHAGGYYWFGPGSSNSREFFGVRLTEVLVEGTAYEVSLYAVRRRWRFAVDHIGVWFGQDSLWENTTAWLNVTPQVKLRDPADEYLVEGYEWSLLKDTLEASGGEQWMVIGNFDVADSVNGILVQQLASPYAYYFIDDVVVRAIGPVNGVAEYDLHGWWDAAGLNIQWSSNLMVDRVIVYDATGRVVAEEEVRPHDTSQRFNRETFASGLYIVHAYGQGTRAVVKIIKGER